jgi:hypothetical protein
MNLRSPSLGALVLAVGTLLAPVRAADLVTIEPVLAGGNTFQYTVHNLALGEPLTDFIVYFPEISGPGEFTNLGVTLLGSPSGWTGTAFEPSAPSLNGFVEWTATGGGLLEGSLLSGFEVSFVYSGLGTPGSQFFEVYDADFNLLTSGQTAVASAAEVPEADAALAATALLGIVGATWHRRVGIRGRSLQNPGLRAIA